MEASDTKKLLDLAIVIGLIGLAYYLVSQSDNSSDGSSGADADSGSAAGTCPDGSPTGTDADGNTCCYATNPECIESTDTGTTDQIGSGTN